MSTGWVKIYRTIADCKTSSRGIQYLGAMAWLIASANHEDKWHDGQLILRGQLFAGIAYLSDAWKVSFQEVRTILGYLSDDHFINKQTTNKGTIITIVNYDTYQCNENDDQQGYQQTINKRSTTNKNDKNINIIQEKNIITKENRFKPPTIDEIKAYIAAKGYTVDAETFYHHYEANGWMIGKSKVKKWQSCVATWERNNKAKGGGHNGRLGSSNSKRYLQENIEGL